MNEAASRVWSSSLLISIVVGFASTMVFYLLMTTMALYAVTTFGANDSLAGFTASVYIVGALVARFVTAKYLDVIGRRRTILISLGLFVVSSALYLFITDLTVLILLRFVHGLAFGVAQTALSVMVFSLVPLMKRAEGISYYSMAGTLAAGIGPMTAALLLGDFGHESLFWASVIASTVAFAGALFLRPAEHPPSAEQRAQLWRFRISDVMAREAIPISLVVALPCLAFSGVVTFYVNYVEQAGNTTADVGGIFFLVYAVTVLVVRIAFGRVQDRYGDNAVFYPTLVAFAAGLCVLALPPGTLSASIAAVLIGIGFGFAMPGGNTIAVSTTTITRMGAATSTFFILTDFAIGLGPLALGLVVSLIGFQGMYLTLAALMLLTIVLYHFLHGYRKATGSSRIVG